MHTFHTIRPGKGSISTRLGSLQGMLSVVANPWWYTAHEKELRFCRARMCPAMSRWVNSSWVISRSPTYWFHWLSCFWINLPGQFLTAARTNLS